VTGATALGVLARRRRRRPSWSPRRKAPAALARWIGTTVAGPCPALCNAPAFPPCPAATAGMRRRPWAFRGERHPRDRHTRRGVAGRLAGRGRHVGPAGRGPRAVAAAPRHASRDAERALRGPGPSP
jgi:hypothetical protein